MLARNVYKVVFRPKVTVFETTSGHRKDFDFFHCFFQASDKETLICLWVCIIINATFATLMAIYYQSVYNLL